MKLSFPPFRSFLPLCSFVTRDGFTDIPIPSIVDWIVASRTPIPEYPEYSSSLLEPLTQIDPNSGMVDFACRANRLFLRATCMKQSGVYAFVQSLSRMDVTQRDRFDVRVVKPKGVLEVVTAAKEGDVMTAVKESEVTPTKESDVMTPTKESDVTPTKESEVMTAVKESEVTPTKESDVMTAVKESEVMTPTKESETLDCVCDNKCGRYYVSER